LRRARSAFVLMGLDMTDVVATERLLDPVEVGQRAA
jgi:hypothetical protein